MIEECLQYVVKSINGIEIESPKVDFKSKWYNLKEKKEIYEFLKDVTSIANTQDTGVKAKDALLTAIAGLSTTFNSKFNKDFATSLTTFINNTAVDSAVREQQFSPSPKEILVYKEVVNDSSLCPWCRSFFLNKDGTPKVYKLKDLQANGSNIGKPKSAWKPTVDATHPRCRCQLYYVKQRS